MAGADDMEFEWNDIYNGEASDYMAPDDAMLERIDTLEPGRALDVGCGAGGLLAALAERGWKVTGIDIAPKAVAAARKVLAARGLKGDVAVADAANWAPGDSFDLVTNSFALPNTQAGQVKLYQAIRSCLAPGGVVLIKDFESSMMRHEQFSKFHCPTVGELETAFHGYEILQAEIVETPAHSHGADAPALKGGWKAVLFCARSPAG